MWSHATMAFDLTFAQVVGECVGVPSTAEELLDRFADTANEIGGIAPDVTFRAALPWALAKLSQEQRLTETFSKGRTAPVYSATENQAAAAASVATLKTSVRDAYLESRKGTC